MILTEKWKQRVALICVLLIFVITAFVNMDWVVELPPVEPTKEQLVELMGEDPNMKHDRPVDCAPTHIEYDIGGHKGKINVDK